MYHRTSHPGALFGIPQPQLEALRAKLGAAEQQVAEHQRREAEARAEINMLATSLAAAHDQHKKVGPCAAGQRAAVGC